MELLPCDHRYFVLLSVLQNTQPHTCIVHQDIHLFPVLNLITIPFDRDQTVPISSMASTLPNNATSPSSTIIPPEHDINNAAVEARQTPDKAKKALSEAHARPETITKHEKNRDRIASASSLEAVGDQPNTLERNLSATQYDMQQSRMDLPDDTVQDAEPMTEKAKLTRATMIYWILIMILSVLLMAAAIFQIVMAAKAW